MCVGRQRLRPLGDEPRELARVLIVAPERVVHSQARRAEEHDRVMHCLPPKAFQRLEILRQDAQRPRLVTLEKRQLLVSRPGMDRSRGHCRHSPLFGCVFCCSRISYHIALSTPKASASPVPRTQLKYHMVLSPFREVSTAPHAAGSPPASHDPSTP